MPTQGLFAVAFALVLILESGCTGVGTDRRGAPVVERPLVAEQPAHPQDAPALPTFVARSGYQSSSSNVAPEPAQVLPASARKPIESETRPRTTAPAPETSNSLDVAGPPPSDTELTLTDALALAGGQSPRIAFAAARYRESYARLESARTLWLPSIRAGISYHHHDGNLQASNGNIVNVNRSSMQAGLGINAVGAGTTVVPGIAAQFHTTDALFQPRIAAHAASAQQAATDAVTNDTLLDTALAYLELLRATQAERIAEDNRQNAQKLADITAQFAHSGQGSQADADRAQTEVLRCRNTVARAEETQLVASARLAEILGLDPSAQIIPQEPTIVPIELVSPDQPLRELVSTGLANRPELAESKHLVCEAVYRYRREKFAPLVPSVLLGVSQSGFAGGLGSTVSREGGRFDFDAGLFWEVRNLGFGERARRDATMAQYDQARAAQTQMMDAVAREVVEAATQVKSRKSQIDVAEAGVAAATQSYNRNLVRIREGQGLPIEVLQSLQALDVSRREYLQTLVDYNQAQFRLQRALGWPVQ